jgi:hypothetical protein
MIQGSVPATVTTPDRLLDRQDVARSNREPGFPILEAHRRDRSLGEDAVIDDGQQRLDAIALAAGDGIRRCDATEVFGRPPQPANNRFRCERFSEMVVEGKQLNESPAYIAIWSRVAVALARDGTNSDAKRRRHLRFA